MASDGSLQYRDIKIGGRTDSPNGILVINKSGFEWSKERKKLSVPGSDVLSASWLRLGVNFQLCLVRSSDEAPVRLNGFLDRDFENIKSFLSEHFSVSLKRRERSTKGWNWGELAVEGSTLNFNVDGHLGFNLDLTDVSHTQVIEGKNEVAIEFHQDDTMSRQEESLLELRFYIPEQEGEEDEANPSELLHKQIMDKARLQSFSGDLIASVSEVPVVVPRGKNDIEFYSSFFKMHGKSADFKIMYTAIQGLYLLPKPNNSHRNVVINLDPPIRKGQTTYSHIVALIPEDIQVEVDVALTPEVLKSKYKDELQTTMSGPMFDVVVKLFRALTGRKIVAPGSFRTANKHCCIRCSIGAPTNPAAQANPGHLYLLEKSFFFLDKPPTHVRYEEISEVSFERTDEYQTSDGGSFDVRFKLKSGTAFVFSQILRSEYTGFFNWIRTKKLRIKNIEEMMATRVERGGDEPDVAADDLYIRRMQQQAAEDEEDSEEEDADFDPTKAKKGKKAGSDDDDESSGGSGKDSDDSDSEDEESEGGSSDDEAPKKASRPAAKKSSSAGSDKSAIKKAKAKKDPNAPKRATTAFFAFGAEMRPKLKEENPSLSVTEVAKELGVRWKALSEEEKQPYNEIAAKDKIRADAERADYTKPDSDSDDSDAGAGSKRKGKSDGAKKKKAKKDPNAPKRATTAFFAFSNEQRAKLKEENPSMSMTDLSKELGVRWKALSEEEKQPYNEIAAKDKIRADAEKADYTKPDSDSDSDSDDGGKKRKGKGDGAKKKKAKKDPNAPKRATTAFFAFGAEMRAKIKEENPSLSMTELSKELGVRWKALSEEEKQPYNDIAAADKKRAAEEQAEYKKGGGGSGASEVKKKAPPPKAADADSSSEEIASSDDDSDE